MALLIVTVGVALFVGVHLVPMVPEWRSALVGRLGEAGYKAGFSVLALAGLCALSHRPARRNSPKRFPASPKWMSSSTSC